MLKNKYTFKYGPQVVNGIITALQYGLTTDAIKSSEYALCLVNLKQLITRLNMALIEGKTEIKLRLNSTEALAIHVCYKKGFIKTSNPFIQEIFTAIDKTL
jgi:hypothetical protein